MQITNKPNKKSLDYAVYVWIPVANVRLAPIVYTPKKLNCCFGSNYKPNMHVVVPSSADIHAIAVYERFSFYLIYLLHDLAPLSFLNVQRNTDFTIQRISFIFVTFN